MAHDPRAEGAHSDPNTQTTYIPIVEHDGRISGWMAILAVFLSAGSAAMIAALVSGNITIH